MHSGAFTQRIMTFGLSKSFNTHVMFLRVYYGQKMVLKHLEQPKMDGSDAIFNFLTYIQNL